MSLRSGRRAPFFSARRRGCVWRGSAPPACPPRLPPGSGGCSCRLPGGGRGRAWRGARAGGVGRAARWGWGGPAAGALPPRRGLSRSLGKLNLPPWPRPGRPRRRRRRASGGDLARGRGSAPAPLPPAPAGRRAAVSRAAGGRRGAPVESSRGRVFPLPGEGRGARGPAEPRRGAGLRLPRARLRVSAGPASAPRSASGLLQVTFLRGFWPCDRDKARVNRASGSRS